MFKRTIFCLLRCYSVKCDFLPVPSKNPPLNCLALNDQLSNYQPVRKDRLTKARRSWNMSRIRGKNTTPEKVVRSLLHKMGYRFRLHGKDLPGRPDIVLKRYKTVIFVHGCFWHRHRRCKDCTTPFHRRAWWIRKLEGNSARDKKHTRALRSMGWRVLVVWQCETEDMCLLGSKLGVLTHVS